MVHWYTKSAQITSWHTLHILSQSNISRINTYHSVPRPTIQAQPAPAVSNQEHTKSRLHPEEHGQDDRCVYHTYHTDQIKANQSHEKHMHQEPSTFARVNASPSETFRIAVCGPIEHPTILFLLRLSCFSRPIQPHPSHPPSPSRMFRPVHSIRYMYAYAPAFRVQKMLHPKKDCPTQIAKKMLFRNKPRFLR
ncbi:hypothetical protein EYC80_009479 [Monilinia laxa]|uniref:Uncharacterized protein n=1 Tax=Monilinia laxa TaxID=61186 RepID=A0A5N6JY08_MONLA|nr:hypothetical protein EYC80_009479 [Monilinia laxa]